MRSTPPCILKSVFCLLVMTVLSFPWHAHSQTTNVYQQTTEVGANVPVDMDEDGMHNWWELLYGLDPLDPSDAALDSDLDNLTNLTEFQYRTNPRARDTDGGGVWDDMEIKLNKNPLDPTDDYTPITNKPPPGEQFDPRGDADGDGLSDVRESQFGTNKNSVDTEGDGVNDYDELFKYLTNPLLADTDVDGVNDYDEIYKYFTDPNNRDSDFDGLLDSEEIFTYKTSPTFWDTDLGGMSDRDEILNGTNPRKRGDEFQFVWNIYFGLQPNSLFKTLEFNKIDIFQGMNLNLEAVKPAEAKRVTIRFNHKDFETEKDYIKLKLLSPEQPGLYTIDLKLYLETGQEVILTRFVEVKQRGRIISRADGTFNELYSNLDYFDSQPIEGAKIEVFIYSQLTDSLQLFSSDVFEIANPSYTDALGSYLLPLHPGEYLIKISKPGLGLKEILYSTDSYALYSQDIYLTYNYDEVVWGAIFVSTFLSVYLLINFLFILSNTLRHISRKGVRSRKAF